MDCLDVLDDEFTVQELSVRSDRPDEAPEHEARGQWNVDYDLLHGGLLLVPDGDQVTPTHPPNPPGDVEEEYSRGDELPPVALVPAHDEVGQPIGPAQQPLLPVVVEPPLGLLHRGLYSQGRGAVGGVELQRRRQLLQLLLLPLGELLRLLARCQPRNVRGGWLGRCSEQHRRHRQRRGECLESLLRGGLLLG